MWASTCPKGHIERTRCTEAPSQLLARPQLRSRLQQQLGQQQQQQERQQQQQQQQQQKQQQARHQQEQGGMLHWRLPPHPLQLWSASLLRLALLAPVQLLEAKQLCQKALVQTPQLLAAKQLVPLARLAQRQLSLQLSRRLLELAQLLPAGVRVAQLLLQPARLVVVGLMVVLLPSTRVPRALSAKLVALQLLLLPTARVLLLLLPATQLLLHPRALPQRVVTPNKLQPVNPLLYLVQRAQLLLRAKATALLTNPRPALQLQHQVALSSACPQAPDPQENNSHNSSHPKTRMHHITRRSRCSRNSRRTSRHSKLAASACLTAQPPPRLPNAPIWVPPQHSHQPSLQQRPKLALNSAMQMQVVLLQLAHLLVLEQASQM